MLGKTHEVTAPTGLLKVMESAVAAPGITCATQPGRHSRVLLRANVRPQQCCAPEGTTAQDAQMQQPACARLKARADPPICCVYVLCAAVRAGAKL